MIKHTDHWQMNHIRVKTVQKIEHDLSLLI